MKTSLYLLHFLLLLGTASASGQNLIKVDMDQQKLAAPVTVAAGDITIQLQGNSFQPADRVQVEYVFGAGPTRVRHTFNASAAVTLTAGADLPSAGSHTALTIYVYFIKDGKGFSLNLDGSGVCTYGGPAFSPYLAPYAYDESRFSTPLLTEAGYIDKYKNSNLVIYNPCDNDWKVYRNGVRKKFLKYKGSANAGNRGAVFLIDHFNTALYTISATNSFISFSSNIPDVFTSVAGIIAPALSAQNDANPVNFPDFIKLNVSLKQLLSHDCGDFQTAKQELAHYVANRFSSITNNFASDIAASYKQLKKDDMASLGLTEPNLNKKYVADYQLIITPDSLVKEDVALYAAVKNNPFIYQYNVIQLQNVDQLQFTLNITPKASNSGTSNNTGAINVVNQNINIPIIGGVKVDFSTGFYYSNVRNATYSLSNNTTNQLIAKETNDHWGTVGVAGLIQAYYPFNDTWVPALSFGLGKSLDLNYSVLAGVSVMFNVSNQNKIGLSYGYNLSSVKQLAKGEYDAAGNYLPQPLATTALNYTNNFSHGHFFSLTYSFGLTKATQPASASAAAATPAASTTPAATTTTGSGGGAGAGGGGHH